MPVQTPQKAGSEFLREFNFSTGLLSCLKRVFGEIPKPSWLEVSLQHAGADSLFLHQNFALEIKTSYPTHASWVHSDQLRSPGGGVLEISVPKYRQIFSTSVPDFEIRDRRETVPRRIIHWVETVLHEIAPQFYECDPRLGWLCKEANDQLPRSPFFDPSGGPKWPRSGWHFFQEELDPIGALTSQPVQVGHNYKCFICGQRFTMRNCPMWAGGNVLWLHKECWGKA